MFSPTKLMFASPGKLHSRGRRDVCSVKGSAADNNEQLDTSLLDIEDFDENAVDFNLLQQAISEPLPLSTNDVLLLNNVNALCGGTHNHATGGQSGVASQQQCAADSAVPHSSRQYGSVTSFRGEARPNETGTYAESGRSAQPDAFTSPRGAGVHAQRHSTPSTVCSTLALPSFAQSEDSSHSNSEFLRQQKLAANQPNLNSSLNQSIASMSPSHSNGPTPTKVRIVFNEKTNQFTINRLRMVSPPNVVDSGFVNVSSAASMSITNASNSVFGAPQRVSTVTSCHQTATVTTSTQMHASQTSSAQTSQSNANRLSNVSLVGMRKSTQNCEPVADCAPAPRRNETVAFVGNPKTTVHSTSMPRNVSFGDTHCQLLTNAPEQLEVLSVSQRNLSNASSSRLTSTPVSNKSSMFRRTSTSSSNTSRSTTHNTVGGVHSSPMPSLLASSFAHDVEIVTPSKTVSNVDELIHGSIVASFSEVIGSSSMLTTPFKTPLKLPPSRTVTPALDAHPEVSPDLHAHADVVDGVSMDDLSMRDFSQSSSTGFASRARRRLMDDQAFANVTQYDATAPTAGRHSLSLNASHISQSLPVGNVNASLPFGDPNMSQLSAAIELKRRVGTVWRSAAIGNTIDQRIMTQLARRFSHSHLHCGLISRRASVSTLSNGSSMQQVAKAIGIGKRRHGSLDEVE